MRSVKMPKTRINWAGEEQDMPLSQECVRIIAKLFLHHVSLEYCRRWSLDVY